MKAVDVIVLLLVAAAVVAAVIHSIRARRKRGFVAIITHLSGVSIPEKRKPGFLRFFFPIATIPFSDSGIFSAVFTQR